MVAHSKPQSFMSMLLTVFVLLQATVAFSHNAHSHPAHRSPAAMEAHLEDTRSLLVARADKVIVKGITDGQYPRLEIREMKKNADQWNLFLLAMERFQNKPKTDPTSYYQIAGIHGRPYVSWNGGSQTGGGGGYCPHGQNTFGTWHRPYLAVYEQAVYQNAQEVVASFPRNQQQRWQKVLPTLRIPYYDWAAEPPRGEAAIPTSMRDQTVTVTKPQGQVTIRNPLYSYTWGTSLPTEMGWGPSNGFATTLRRPVQNPTRSNNNAVNAIFGQARVGWRQRVFALFSSKQPWGYASTAAFGVKTSRSNADSFESIHDDIHSTVGGTDGHMAYLDVAAFDPFFWLHHTNVDRLLAMYQLVTPDSWVVPGKVNRDMFQWKAGQTNDANTPLVPFPKDNSGSAYSSNDVKETRVFGYYYPETQQRSSKQVIQAVNQLYGMGERQMTKRDGNDAAPIYGGRPFQAGDYDTVLSVVGDKYAMPGSYQVHCFLGAESSNGTAPSHLPTGIVNSTVPTTKPINGTTGNGTADFEYGFPSSYVGSHTFLGGSMANGNGSAPTLVEGCIPLTAALQEKQANGQLASLHPEHVEPYLKENLSYKIIGPNGQEFAPEDVPNFHVKVKSCEVEPTTSDDELPGYKEYTELPNASLPASAPWQYTPGPLDTTPDTPAPAPEGYCVSQQTIHYVDPAGNFLYAEVTGM